MDTCANGIIGRVTETPVSGNAAVRSQAPDGIERINIMQISIVWSTADVFEVRDDLTVEQANEVLESLKENHDANIGINWNVIEAQAEAMYPAESEEMK